MRDEEAVRKDRRSERAARLFTRGIRRAKLRLGSHVREPGPRDEGDNALSMLRLVSENTQKLRQVH